MEKIMLTRKERAALQAHWTQYDLRAKGNDIIARPKGEKGRAWGVLMTLKDAKENATLLLKK